MRHLSVAVLPAVLATVLATVLGGGGTAAAYCDPRFQPLCLCVPEPDLGDPPRSLLRTCPP